MANNGMFLIHSNIDNVSYIYTVNGQLLYNLCYETVLTSAAFSIDSHVIISGHINGDIIMYQSLTGKEITHFLEDENDSVLCMCVLPSDQGIIVGHKSGNIYVYTP